MHTTTIDHSAEIGIARALARGGAPNEDRLVRAAARWLELQLEVVDLLRKREQLYATALAEFEDIRSLDPRGVTSEAADAPAPWLRRMARYEQAYIASGAGEISARLDVLFAEQEELEQRLLMDDASPPTVAGALAVARVCVTWLAHGAGVDDEGEGDMGYTVFARARMVLDSIARLAGH